MSTAEVQRLARQGDSDALYEMVWRLELLPPEHGNDPVERCAWQDCWFEEAAEAGHIDAKQMYARSLLDRVMDAEWRQKAMHYLQSIVNDYDAGKLNDEDGFIAKLWLGIMLCEGYYTQRDVVKGAKLIHEADVFFGGFKEFGFKTLAKIGETYAYGYAQESEVPSSYDLIKAIKYLNMAVERFKPENDPNHRGYKQFYEDLIRVCEDRQNSVLGTHPLSGSDNRQKMMEISPAAAERVKADKAALARLRKRLKQDGWNLKYRFNNF